MSAPEPPKGYRIIPREYLAAGNLLPWDALFWGACSKNWLKCPGRGQATSNVEYLHATAELLPCFDSAPATGDAARIAELERQLAEARAELQKAKEWNWLTEFEVKNLRSIVSDQDEDTQKMKAQLAASEKDKARIDWLEANAAKELRIDSDGAHVQLDRWHQKYITCHSWGGTTLRAAIDAAMKEAK